MTKHTLFSLLALALLASPFAASAAAARMEVDESTEAGTTEASETVAPKPTQAVAPEAVDAVEPEHGEEGSESEFHQKAEAMEEQVLGTEAHKKLEVAHNFVEEHPFATGATSAGVVATGGLGVGYFLLKKGVL